MFKKLLFFLIVTSTLSGCRSPALDLKIRYKEIHGLKNGDRIVFEDKQIGKVDQVSYTQNGSYLVDVSIKNEFANLATENSMFFITSDPLTEGQKAIEMIPIHSGGSQLKKGEVVEGSTKFSARYSRMQNNLKKKIVNLKTKSADFFTGFQRLSESEQIKRIERELSQIIVEMKQLNKSMQVKLRTEVLPQIEQKIKNLRQRLKELGREEELKPIENKLKIISNELTA